MNTLYLVVFAAVLGVAASTTCGTTNAECGAGKVCAGKETGKSCHDTPCKTDSCSGHGDCVPGALDTDTPAATCPTCKDGYTGTKCETPPGHPPANECEKDADCKDASKPKCKDDAGTKKCTAAGGSSTGNKCDDDKGCTGSTPHCIGADGSKTCSANECEDDKGCSGSKKYCTGDDGSKKCSESKNNGNQVSPTTGLLLMAVLIKLTMSFL